MSSLFPHLNAMSISSTMSSSRPLSMSKISSSSLIEIGKKLNFLIRVRTSINPYLLFPCLCIFAKPGNFLQILEKVNKSNDTLISFRLECADEITNFRLQVIPFERVHYISEYAAKSV